MKETLASEDTFRVQAIQLIPNYNKNYAINTDQTGMLRIQLKNYISFDLIMNTFYIFRMSISINVQ